MEIIDTHCHLFAEEFDADREAVINRALEAGVSRFLLPNIDAGSIGALYKTADTWPVQCLPMMGLHPTSVKEDYQVQMKRVEEELGKRSFVAIGEIGLDYYWDTTLKAGQQDVFRQQLKLAKKYNLPVAIHTRNSFEDALTIVREEKDERLSGVFHCFTGSIQDAEAIIELGFYMGIGGVLTYKNGGLDKVVPDISRDHLLLETDSPYLSPVPFRGKRNESAYLVHVLEKLAALIGVSNDEAAAITSRNAKRLFKLS